MLPRRTDLTSRRRSLRPLLWLLIPLLLIAAATLGLAAYGSTEPPLDWEAGEPPRIVDKLRDMLATGTLTATISEAEVNALLLPELYERRRLGENAEITGARVGLTAGGMAVRTDVTLFRILRLPIFHTLTLDWEKPDVKATHVASSLKGIPLPASLFPIHVVRVPLKLDDRMPAELDQVEFEEGGVKLTFRLANPFR